MIETTSNHEIGMVDGPDLPPIEVEVTVGGVDTREGIIPNKWIVPEAEIEK